MENLEELQLTRMVVRVALDTPLVDVLESTSELTAPGTTVRHLLAHTSGMGDYLDESTIADVEDYVLAVPVHRLERPGDFLVLMRGRAPRFAPGAASRRGLRKRPGREWPP